MPHARKVLIVDDDNSVRLLVKTVMEAEGWKTIEGLNGEEAIDLARREQPDLILLDLEMPIVDGFQAFEKLRSSPFTENIPIIVFSGLARLKGTVPYAEDDFATAFDVRAPEGFIEKPVDVDTLRQCIFGVVG